MLNPWLDLPSEPPFVLPADRENLATLSRKITASGRGEHAINLESLPEPFIGNPDSATVLLLNMNPGDSPDDKKAHDDPAFREALLCNLRQEEQNFPFYPLNPDLKWTACANWWTNHVHWLLEHPALNRQRIAQRLCVIEWFPYHSKRNGVPKRSVLPSQDYCFEMVKKALGKKLIVGMRARGFWTDVDARLADIPYLKNPQAPYISPRNAGESLFSKIVEALR